MWIIPKNYKLSSAFAQGMVESREDLSLLGYELEHSLKWRSKPTQYKTWLQRWKRVSWMQHLYTRMLKPSHRKSFEEQLTLSLEAIRVSRLAKQEKEKEKKTQDTYSPILENTSMQLDLIDACSKMSQDTLRLDSPQLSATWKKMVTEQRGEYSLRKKLADITKEKESVSWATQMLPTPRTSDAEGGRIETYKTDGGWKSLRKKSGQLFGAKLRDAIETEAEKYPTPATRDYKGANKLETIEKKINDGKRGHMGTLPNFVVHKEKTNLALNPYWVEALMGIPQGWTALDGAETEMQGTWEDNSWEEGIPRVIKDCLNRVDRVRMCGNGVVPQTAALAWKVLSNKLEDEYEG